LNRLIGRRQKHGLFLSEHEGRLRSVPLSVSWYFSFFSRYFLIFVLSWECIVLGFFPFARSEDCRRPLPTLPSPLKSRASTLPCNENFGVILTPLLPYFFLILHTVFPAATLFLSPNSYAQVAPMFLHAPTRPPLRFVSCPYLSRTRRCFATFPLPFHLAPASLFPSNTGLVLLFFAVMGRSFL